MKPGAPWSIKGVDPDARELAKARARDAGMTLGQWLNATISKADSPQAGMAATPAPAPSSTSALDTARVLRAVAEVARRVDTLQAERSGTAPDSNHSAELERTLAEISARVDEISMRPVPAIPEVDTGRIEAKISTLANQVAELQARPAAAAPDLSSLDTAISALNNRVERLAGSVSGSSAPDPELMTAITDLNKQLEDAADRRGESGAPAVDDELQSTLSQLSERMDVLADAAKKAPVQPVVGHNADPAVAEAASQSLDEQGRNIIKLMNGMVNIAAKVDAVHTEVEDRVAPLDEAVTALKADLARGEQAASDRVAPIEQAVHEIRQAVEYQATESQAAIGAMQNALQDLSDQQRHSIAELQALQSQPVVQQVMSPVAPAPEPEPEPEHSEDNRSDHSVAAAAAAAAATVAASAALNQTREPEQVQEVPAELEPEHRHVVEDTEPASPPRFDDLASDQKEMRAASSIPASEIFQDFGRPPVQDTIAETREEQQEPEPETPPHREEQDDPENDQPERPVSTIPVAQLLNQGPVHREPEAQAQPDTEPQLAAAPAPQQPEPLREPEPAPEPEPEIERGLAEQGLTSRDIEPDPHLNAAAHMKDPRNAPYMRGEYREPRFRLLKLFGVILLVMLILAGIVLAFISLSAPPTASSESIFDKMGRKIEQMFSPPDKAAPGDTKAVDDQSSLKTESGQAETTANVDRPAPATDNGSTAQATLQPVTEGETDSQQAASLPAKKKQPETLNENGNNSPNSDSANKPDDVKVAATEQPQDSDTTATAEPAAEQPETTATAPETVATTVDQAASAGDADAQFAMGERYKNGDGVNPSYQKAAEWFERAAAAGNVQAQYNLGVMLRQGLGVPKDLTAARKWLELAANENHADAQKILAEVYAQDDQGNPDYFAAAQWFERAAEQGVVDAQFNVALMYSGGLGVEPDQIKAYRWFGIAGRNGDQEAKREQQKVGAGLGANDRAGLDREIAAWQPKKLWTPPQNKWLAATGNNAVSADAILTRRDQIKKVQQLLLAYGYDPGTPDGLPGARTQRAIREWQRDNNMLVDGRLTGNVLNRLQKDQ